VFFIKIAKMTKITIISILFLAVFTSCQKDCEKDHTATLRFINNEQVNANVFLPGGQFTEDDKIEVLAGETATIIVNTDVSVGGRKDDGWKAVVDVEWSDNTQGNVVIDVVTCDVNEVTLEK